MTPLSPAGDCIRAEHCNRSSRSCKSWRICGPADYKAAFARGLKLAMSNKAGSWEYKLEAAKEIPFFKLPLPSL